MRKIAYLVLFLVMLPILIGGAISCKSSTSPSSSLDESIVRAYADPATETTLQGLSENNLAKYIQHGNAQFKAAVTQQILDTTATQISGELGTYQSKEFLRTEEQEGYIIVHYKAKFTKGDVGIRMVFDKDHLVAGQWFE
ncbi:MAG: DUF3887 domain-containing protein [Dehalococcoidales bacterium]